MVKSGFEYAWSCLKEIKDRTEKIEISNAKAAHILKQVEFIGSQLNKIEDYVDDTEDSQQLEQFYLHLKIAKEICHNECPKNYIAKFVKAPSTLVQLDKIEEELKEATLQLNTFLEALQLIKSQENHADLSSEIAKIRLLSECPDFGINVPIDKFKKNQFLLNYR